MTIREYEKAVSELRAAVQSLTEENTLLRDFAYNIDPTARTVHTHMFNQQKIPQTGSFQGQKARSYSARNNLHQDGGTRGFNDRRRSSSGGRHERHSRHRASVDRHETVPIPDTSTEQFLLAQKVDELASKLGNKALK